MQCASARNTTCICTVVLLIAHQHGCTETQPEQHTPPSKIPEHHFNLTGQKTNKIPNTSQHPSAPLASADPQDVRFRPPRYLCTFLRWPLTGPPAQTSGISDPERTHRVAPNGKKKTSKEAKGGKSEERRTHHRWFLGIMACAGMTSFVPTSCRTIPSHVIIHFLRSTMRFILRCVKVVGLRSNRTLSLQLGWRTS